MNVYISSPPGWEFDPPFWEDASSPRRMTLVELGAGTGIVSLQIANTLSERSLGDIIFMTDLPEVCPLLDDNARKHLLGGTRQDRQLKSPMLRVLPLSWGNTQNAKDLLSSIRQPCADSDRGLTHIVCSDLVSKPTQLASRFLRSSPLGLLPLPPRPPPTHSHHPHQPLRDSTRSYRLIQDPQPPQGGALLVYVWPLVHIRTRPRPTDAPSGR